VFVPQPALTAYRRDSERLPHAPAVEGLLAGVLVFARLFESIAANAAAFRSKAAQAAATLSRGIDATTVPLRVDTTEAEPDVTLDPTAEEQVLTLVREHELLGAARGSGALPERVRTFADLAELARRIADRAEQAGALDLANSLLFEIERLCELLPAVEHGRVLAQRARVARKANAYEAALHLYKQVGALGRRLDLGELRARARIGFGLLAEVRGNLPEAARHFQTAAREAKRAAVVDVLRVAQRGRMTIAARRGDFSSALVFAWDAYVDACGDSAAEAEMLGNLAQLALDVGRTDAALAGFSAALDRRPGPRIALPVLGGAARAAAALERRELVERFAREIDAYRSDERFAYAIASSLLDLALAFANHDGAAAHDRVTAGLSLAEKYGFHELDFRLREVGERLVTRRRHDTHAEQVQVAPRGETVLRHLIHEATLGEEDRRSSRRRAAVPAH